MTEDDRPVQVPTLQDLLAERCETFTEASGLTCASEGSGRILGSYYGATEYCWPCRLRAILSHRFEDATNRGFGITEFYYRDYDNTGEQRFSVQESSLATERKVWIGPGDERAHLNEDEARRVRDALSAFLGE